MHIIARAVALKLLSLIPANWNQKDGSLSDTTPEATEDTVVEPEVRERTAYVDVWSGEVMRSERVPGHRAPPEIEAERQELRDVQSEIIVPLMAFLSSLDPAERTEKLESYEPNLRAALDSYNSDIEKRC